MTYHRNSDIHIPYGEIVEKDSYEEKDIKTIVSQKTKSVLWIASNCHTFSWREEYVKELQKYIPVDVFGECGDDFAPWKCGERHIHNECFDVLNEYFFFLSFENALCQDYFTEKVFENYHYNTVLVVRGGLRSNLKDVLPDNTYIDVSKYQNPKELAKELNNLINDVSSYTEMLEKKQKYHSVPYHELYQRALCQLCDVVTAQEPEKMERYYNLRNFYHERNFCRLPTDIRNLD